MTHNAAMGLIAARDFVDLVVNIKDKEFVGTLGMYVQFIGSSLFP